LIIEEYRDWIDLGKYVSAIILSIGIVSWMSQQIKEHVKNLGAHMEMINGELMNVKHELHTVTRSLSRHVDQSQSLRNEITDRIETVEHSVSKIVMRKGDKNGRDIR
jgi:DNA anti-recombination protein RmuC